MDPTCRPSKQQEKEFNNYFKLIFRSTDYRYSYEQKM
jgi:hypothetical protein